MAHQDHRSEVTEETAAREIESEQQRRPYQPPRITVFDTTTSVLGPLASPTADGASGAFRP